MKTITRVAKVSTAFVAVSLLALTGCSSESTTPDDSSSEPAKGESDVKVQELSVDGGGGHADIDRASIVCVEGTAFLYIYSGIMNSRQGGPSIERFKEQDATCVELED